MSRLGWSRLRPVQELAGQAILDGMNAVILAPTAGGKTEASIFPVLAALAEHPPQAVGAIYLAPIKALLNNQAERLGIYTEMVGMRRFLWHGDVTDGEKRRFVREPCELLMTTPESLEVMLLSPRVPHPKLFCDLRVVIVDEVHALAGTDRGTHLLSVLERLCRHTEHDVQRIGLSATVGNPHEILAWLQGSSRRPGIVVDPPKEPSKKDLQVRLCLTEAEIAAEAARLARGQKSLFFCQSRALTEHIAQKMRHYDIDVFVHHSSVSLEERHAAEERFHRGNNVAIVCTSTLELGIDVGDLDRVFQADAPSTVSSFLQRMGRTGRRADQRANTTFFCQDGETVLQAAALIELARKGWVESIPPVRRAWPVLVHQLLALTLEFGGISQERCWEQLSRVPDFSGIGRDEFDALIDHMLREEYLFAAGGLLSMGEVAERAYGRKNFSELYAVFSSPVLFTVATETGHVIGSLEQTFVDTLVVGMSSFLLGGRGWTVLFVNYQDRVVKVTPAPRGKKPSWGSFAPQMLSRDLCAQMVEIIVSDAPLPYLDEPARAALGATCEDLAPMLRGKGLHLQVEPDRTLWWNFAGGRINHTIKYGLMLEFGAECRIVADNFKLKFEGMPGTVADLRAALGRMARSEFWEDEGNDARLLAMLPEYRLSKFQRALPARWSMEMVGAYLLDVEGAVNFLRLLALE